LGIGFSTSLAAGGMRSLILELIQTLPGVQLSGFERGRRRLSQALYAGTIDFAVLSGGFGPMEGIGLAVARGLHLVTTLER
jgi:hypothetical protein